jgi:hypothetical protein
MTAMTNKKKLFLLIYFIVSYLASFKSYCQIKHFVLHNMYYVSMVVFLADYVFFLKISSISSTTTKKQKVSVKVKISSFISDLMLMFKYSLLSSISIKILAKGFAKCLNRGIKNT